MQRQRSADQANQSLEYDSLSGQETSRNASRDDPKGKGGSRSTPERWRIIDRVGKYVMRMVKGLRDKRSTPLM